jgi:hypothetical protein
LVETENPKSPITRSALRNAPAFASFAVSYHFNNFKTKMTETVPARKFYVDITQWFSSQEANVRLLHLSE